MKLIKDDLNSKKNDSSFWAARLKSSKKKTGYLLTTFVTIIDQKTDPRRQYNIQNTKSSQKNLEWKMVYKI